MALHDVSTGTQTHWEIDPENTTVEFSVGKSRLLRVRGQFRRVRGSAVAYGDPHDNTQRVTQAFGGVPGGYSNATIEVEIDAASIDTGFKMRDWHLRTTEFLKVKRFPTLTFQSARVEDLGQDRLRVFGELTIRGITRKVALEATVEHRDSERAQITASTVLDRRDFKIGPKPMGLLVGNDMAVHAALVLRAR